MIVIKRKKPNLYEDLRKRKGTLLMEDLISLVQDCLKGFRSAWICTIKKLLMKLPVLKVTNYFEQLKKIIAEMCCTPNESKYTIFMKFHFSGNSCLSELLFLEKRNHDLLNLNTTLCVRVCV